MTSLLTAHSARTAYVLLTLTTLFWSGNIVIGRWAADHVPPVLLACLRWSGAALLILPLALRHLIADGAQIRAGWRSLVPLGLLGSGLFNTLQYLALTQTTATNTALIYCSTPLLIALASRLFFRDRISRAEIAGIGVACAGVLIVVGRGEPGRLLELAVNPGDLLMLAAVLVWAVYTAFLRLRPTIHPMSFAAATYIIAALVNVPLALIEHALGARMIVSTPSLLAVAYTAVFPSLLAYLCFNRGVEIIGATKAGAFMYLTPLFATTLAVLLLGERPEPYHLAGFALILAGVALATRAR